MSMNNWLATKYGILQQQADTAAAAQRSQAGLQGAYATQINALTPGKVAETGAQTRLTRGQAGLLEAKLPFASEAAQSEADFLRAKALNENAQGVAEANNNFGSFLGLPGIGEQVQLRGGMVPEREKPRLAKGTARVPGKGDGTKDTVPAVLAPGEAVLNKAAAEHVGRGLIAVLNQLGAQKMGMV